MQKLLRACVIGDPDPDLTIEKEKEKTEDKKEEDSFMVAVCFTLEINSCG